jgi:hypothetical protein
MQNRIKKGAADNLAKRKKEYKNLVDLYCNLTKTATKDKVAVVHNICNYSISQKKLRSKKRSGNQKIFW